MQKKLIEQQIQQLGTKSHIEYIKQIDQNSYLVAYFPQLSNSPYSHLVFRVKLILPDKYPEQPPLLIFQDKIYHLNVEKTSGQVSMPFLKDDWSSFLTLSDVFDSLDNILEEPELNCAASEQLKNQYKNEPEKYARKVQQMINLCPREYKDEEKELNESLVEHAQEIGQFRPAQGVVFNQSFEKPQHNQQVMLELKNSLPYSQIPKDNRQQFESQITVNDQYNLENRINRQLHHSKSNNILIEQYKPSVVTEKLDRNKSERNLTPQKKEKNKKKSIVNQFPSIDLAIQKKTQFDEIQQSLRKSDQLIQLLLKECETMENTLNSSQNKRIRQVLQRKLQPQWKMIEELLQMTTKLKQKLFNNIKSQARQLLK